MSEEKLPEEKLTRVKMLTDVVNNLASNVTPYILLTVEAAEDGGITTTMKSNIPRELAIHFIKHGTPKWEQG